MSTHHAVKGQVGSQSQLALWKDKILPFLMSGGLGIVLLYGAAFAETEALHNAAHDSRHSASFPCH